MQMDKQKFDSTVKNVKGNLDIFIRDYKNVYNKNLTSVGIDNFKNNDTPDLKTLIEFKRDFVKAVIPVLGSKEQDTFKMVISKIYLDIEALIEHIRIVKENTLKKLVEENKGKGEANKNEINRLKKQLEILDDVSAKCKNIDERLGGLAKWVIELSDGLKNTNERVLKLETGVEEQKKKEAERAEKEKQQETAKEKKKWKLWQKSCWLV